MIAKIKGKNSVYESVVFAINYSGWNTKIIAFDESYTNLISIKYWGKNGKINVLITNYDCSSWKINTKEFKSYWNIKNIFRLANSQKLDLEILTEAKMMQTTFITSEWNCIKSNDDCDSILSSSLGFHDAYVEKIESCENTCKLFFNTTWGSYILLECTDVFNNTLDLNNSFFACTVEIRENKIHFNFVGMYDSLDDLVLEAGSVRWKAYFEDKHSVTNNDHNLINNEFSFFDAHGQNFKINMDEIFEFENCQIGIIKLSYDAGSYIFVKKDTVVVISIARLKREAEEEFAKRFYEIKNTFNQSKYLLWENVNDFSEKNFDEFNQQIYGKKLHEEIYPQSYTFLYMFKFAAIPLLGNIILWLIIQLFNPQMKWAVFYVFGIGISSLLFLVYLIAYFKGYHGITNKLTIFENSIVLSGNIKHMEIPVDNIREIEYGKRIVIYTNNNKRIRLLKSKDGKIYEILKSLKE